MAGSIVLSVLKHAWQTLEPLSLPMAVMGGVAMALWNRPRATHDVDLLLASGETDLSVLMAALGRASIRPIRRPPLLTLGTTRIIQFLYEPPGTYIDVQLDLLLADSEYQQVALTRGVPARLPTLDIEVRVLSCEDLILHKLLAGRILDRADVAALLRANQPELNLEYLTGWVRRLHLAAVFAEVWEEAFPGESPPASEA